MKAISCRMGFAHCRCLSKQNIALKMVGNNKDIAHPTKTVIVGVETGVQTLVCAYAKLKLADSITRNQKNFLLSICDSRTRNWSTNFKLEYKL